MRNEHVGLNRSHPGAYSRRDPLWKDGCSFMFKKHSQLFVMVRKIIGLHLRLAEETAEETSNRKIISKARVKKMQIFAPLESVDGRYGEIAIMLFVESTSSMISYVLQKLIFCATGNERTSEFSDHEIAAIRDVWIRARNSEVGVKILAALIEKKPSFAAYYGFETSLSIEELQKSETFLFQAQRIQDFLDTIVSSLGICPDSAVHRMAYRIGQIHFHKGVNFGADNWLVFKKVTVDQ
ncbi:globin, partial [Necator americanus]